MNDEQVVLLFKKYLERNPTKEEIDFHKIKNYNDFETEIKQCEEYQSKKLVKPKIAFLLSGHIRNANIFEFLNQNTNIDVFVSCWDSFGFRGSEKNLTLKNKDQIEKKIKNIKNLKDYEILNNKEFVDKNKNSDIQYYNFSSPEVFIKSQLFSINRSFKIFENYKDLYDKEYEIVFKCRFDTSISKFAITSKTLNNIKNKKIIFVTNNDCHFHPDFPNGCLACNKMYEKNMFEPHVFEHTNIICDFFAYGNFDNMKKYCSLYNEYDNLNKNFENINLKSIQEKKIKFNKINNVTHLSHEDSIYYAYCSYPERMLQLYLKEYMMVSSRDVLVNFHS